MVGCVIARGDEVVGEGFHRRFGGPHAEIEALAAAGSRAAGATLYVTLEPCCHHGKTPPCTRAVVDAGVRRVVAAQRDPFPAVQGRGIAELQAAGVAVELGLLAAEARRLNAPYLKLVGTGRPWIVAKWAMTLDGKIATRAGESRWISGAASRERGSFTPRPHGRDHGGTGDGRAGRPPADCPAAGSAQGDSRRARHAGLATRREPAGASARDDAVLVAVGESAPAAARQRLEQAGCEVFVCRGQTPAARLDALLAELGRRRLTNVLVEGGSRLLGSLFDARQIDEVHVFIAPKLCGGESARAGHRRRGDRPALGRPGVGLADRGTRRRRRVHPCPPHVTRTRRVRVTLCAVYIRRQGPMVGGFLQRKSRGPRTV